MTGEGDDGGSVAGFESDEVGGGGFVAVCWAPECEVGDGAEVDGSLDRLMSRAIFTETDGVVCC